MQIGQASSRNMARPVSMISEIKNLRQTLRVAVRITRLWYVDNKQYAPTLEMILMDSKGDKIHATIRDKDLLAKWKPILKEGDSYEMQNFIVQRADGQYRNTNHIFKFIFSTGTIAKEIQCSQIPTNCYHLTSFEDILSGKASRAILVDVIGQLTDRGKYYPDAERKKAIISLKDQSGKILRCTLWEGHASKLTNYIDNNKGIPIIIMLTLAKIHDPIANNYPVAISNSKWSSTLLINEDIKEINDFKSSMGVIEIYASGSQMMSQISGSSQYSQSSQWATMDRFFYKADVMTLAEICNLRQETQCCTVATIDNVLAGYGWSYDHCTRCNKSARTCGCGDQNNKIETRFRVEVMVSYKEDSTKFVLWDTDCQELLNCTASELKKQMIAAGEIEAMAIPATVDNLEGKTLAFKLKVQPRYRRSSVVKASQEQQIIEQVIKQFPVEELHTDSKGKVVSSLKSPTSDKQIEGSSINMDIANLEQSQSLSTTAEFDHEALDTITPAKRLSTGIQFDEIPTQDLGDTQLSSTKLAKHIKME